MPDHAPDTLIDGFIGFLETGQDSAGVMAPDVFADVNVPQWRFQMQGVAVIGELLQSEAPSGSTVTRGRCWPTPTGFVVELQQQQDDQAGPRTIYRTAYMVETDGGRIREFTLYCTGAWDQDTQARQAAEAPMIRP